MIRKKLKRQAFCRGCDKAIEKETEVIYTRSHRNRGQHIYFCLDCAKIIGEIGTQDNFVNNKSSQAKKVPALNQNPIIWGDGWYAIPDNSNDELTWPVSPKKYFDKTGYCPDGWEGDIPEGWTVDELNNFIDKHGCEPNPPEGFSYCMETTMKCTKDWSFERQKEALIEAGYIIANPKDAKWL